jgi:hypothetical protein
MDKKLTALVILFFFLFTLAYGETGRIKLARGDKKSTAKECNDSYPDGEEEDRPDAEEEDTSKGRETDDREMDEYESMQDVFFLLPANPLLNSRYTYQHLLFKEHFIEAAVPPPRD